MIKKVQRVCVIIPAYNESAVIRDVLKNAKKIFSASPYDIAIVLVNDSSKDNTANIALKEKVTVINHIINTGAGGATATGLRYAKNNHFDIAATMDADGQHDPNDVIKGIRQIEKLGSDLLLGSRLIDSSGMSKIKVIGNKGLSVITYVLFGVNSTDSQSGLRLFSRKAIDSLRWHAGGYEFASEMLWKARQLKLTVNEYPIKAIYTEYSKSKGQNNWNAINIVKSMIKHRISETFG